MKYYKIPNIIYKLYFKPYTKEYQCEKIYDDIVIVLESIYNSLITIERLINK